MKTLFYPVFLFLVFQTAIGQTSNEYYYAIWIRKFEKKWIDSEDNFYIVYTTDLDNAFRLALRDGYETQLCCETFISQKKNSGHYSEENFFEENKTLKIKIKSLTIRILKLQGETCTCTTKSIYGLERMNPPVRVKLLKKYKAIKFLRSEKKKFRKIKKIYFELLNN
ncbi:hypothetical protein NHF50_15215 [Flavobacterium sp. NRK F10]|uniref:hypothetical protein n=1 Tax=Flavobacterium sp. NRK F10 TaxID=2954931 RepID=UPI0020906C64|nr:hypothetical protein [Flavobacterium sp. NRK F10]MCO6176398.1 hypothetical protein [Flavobacterium sp. NRK F10]